MVDFKFDALYSYVFTESLLSRFDKNIYWKFLLVGGTARANPTWRVLPHSLILLIV